jgi:hypothetical protein
MTDPSEENILYSPELVEERERAGAGTRAEAAGAGLKEAQSSSSITRLEGRTEDMIIRRKTRAETTVTYEEKKQRLWTKPGPSDHPFSSIGVGQSLELPSPW